MGDESKQQEQPKEEAKQVQEKREEPKASVPFIIHVNLHCPGCARKIYKSIMRIRGVEEVIMDTSKDYIEIKGVVEHQAVCDIVAKKTKRKVTIVSPDPGAEGKPVPNVVPSQIDALVTVELRVNMHCEGCAEQLKAKILRMRGVQTATTEFSTGKVTVTGTMDASKLVDYVYRRTKKQAQVVPQLQPAPEKKEPEQPPAAPPTTEEKPAEEPAPAKEEKKEEKPAEEEKKEETKPAADKKDESEKNEEKKEEEKETNIERAEGGTNEEESMNRMMYYYQPVYVVERMPPPQLFSDENPNACCIS